MKYFYDTEFIEDGKTIDLISIGIIAEDGREYYAVNSDMPVNRIQKEPWLCRNVIPHLPLTFTGVTEAGPYSFLFNLDRKSTLVRPEWVIANEVREFLLANGEPVDLWADFSAYDHVVLCQLWGRMIDLPKGLPMRTNDFQQKLEDMGFPAIPEQPSGLHDALADARHLRDSFKLVSKGAA